jgi:hypothetical protein
VVEVATGEGEKILRELAEDRERYAEWKSLPLIVLAGLR